MGPDPHATLRRAHRETARARRVLKLVCDHCGDGRSHVVDSRVTTDGQAIWRRRECYGCGARYSTLERTDHRTSP